MKLLFKLTTMLLIAFSNVLTSNTKVAKFNSHIQEVSKVDESELAQEIYVADSLEMSKLLQFNKKIYDNNQFGIEFKLDSDKILELIKNIAYKQEMLTGNTKFEELYESGNLLINYSYWLENIKIYAINEKTGMKENYAKFLRILGYDGLTSDTQAIVISPTSKASEFIINFTDFNFQEIRFFDKRKYTNTGWNSRQSLEELLYTQKNESVNKPDFGTLYMTLNNEWNALIPYSKDWDIIKANQSSEEFKLIKGYNIKIKNEAIDIKSKNNHYKLLLPLIFLIIMILYFGFKKIIRK